MLTQGSSSSCKPSHTLDNMDAPPLEESVESTAPLDHSRNTEQEVSTSFRFVDLPAEIRNKIYRYILVHSHQPIRLSRSYLRPSAKTLAILFTNRFIYSEAMPIFYSNNAFIITGSRKEHTWLRRMRSEGRNELRNITYEVNPGGFKHDYSVYNALSLCSNVHLTLKAIPRCLSTASLHGDLRNMHGFAAVTSDVLPDESDKCPRHQLVVLETERMLQRDRMRRVKALLQQFQQPCVGKCRVHKGREGTHTQATIHLSFQETCFFCC